MAASAIPGTVNVSTDSGATWTATNLPGGIWISVDMTADGTRMVAVALNGGMFMSTDSGANWTQIDTAVNPGGTNYESVTISEDGQRIVAVDLSGNIYVSQNGTAATPTFTVTPVAGAAFRSVDSSADGAVVVAASQSGSLHLSTDGGATFAALPVVVGAPVNDNWYRAAVSPDGNTIAVAGNTDYAGALVSTGLYVSRDRGLTWTQGSATGGAYTSIDTSANGDIIVATMSGAGQVLLSIDGGQTFAPIAAPAGETNWRTVAMTGDASRLLLAAGTFGAATGQLYLSSGSVTGP